MHNKYVLLCYIIDFKSSLELLQYAQIMYKHCSPGYMWGLAFYSHGESTWIKGYLWNRTMLNFCGIVVAILKMETSRNFPWKVAGLCYFYGSEPPLVAKWCGHACAYPMWVNVYCIYRDDDVIETSGQSNEQVNRIVKQYIIFC
jgi:hypothetical protein